VSIPAIHNLNPQEAVSVCVALFYLTDIGADFLEGEPRGTQP